MRRDYLAAIGVVALVCVIVWAADRLAFAYYNVVDAAERIIADGEGGDA